MTDTEPTTADADPGTGLATAAPAGALAIPEDETGLEDFDFATDAVMPRLSIEHKTQVFKDSLTGETFSSLEVILLGLVKQRILWDDEVNEGDKPLCKSFNFQEGRPDEARFPWATSGFGKDAVETDAAGLILPCAACPLKEWGSAPNGKTPWCSEQHTYPLLMKVGQEGEDGWAPALLTVQRTGIKPSKAYLTAFARTKTPLYTVTTKLGLTPQKKGSVEYAVPTFAKGDPTDQEEWGFYAQQMRSIRSFITTAPTKEDEAPPAASAPAAGASPASTPTPPSAAAAPAGDDDDLPF